MKPTFSSIEPLEARIAPAFAAVFAPSSLNGLNGFTIKGESADFLGQSVSSAGDVNGDGFDDLLIGVTGSGSAGASYVVFGKSGGFSAALDVATICTPSNPAR